MKQLLDRDTFMKTMTEKGYDGYFHVESSYAGILEDSIREFLDAWNEGKDAPLSGDHLHLSTYLEWNGEDMPRTECNMWVKYENGNFDLQQTQMYIRRTDQNGALLKQCKLTNLTSESLPTLAQAIAKVSEKPVEKLSNRNSRFRMR